MSWKHSDSDMIVYAGLKDNPMFEDNSTAKAAACATIGAATEGDVEEVAEDLEDVDTRVTAIEAVFEGKTLVFNVDGTVGWTAST